LAHHLAATHNIYAYKYTFEYEYLYTREHGTKTEDADTHGRLCPCGFISHTCVFTHIFVCVFARMYIRTYAYSYVFVCEYTDEYIQVLKQTTQNQLGHNLAVRW